MEYHNLQPSGRKTVLNWELILIFLNIFILGGNIIASDAILPSEVNSGSETAGAEKKKPDESRSPGKKEKKEGLSGSVGAGLSLTSGNSETINWNISFDINKPTDLGHNLKMNGLYLRGKENGKLSVDRLKLSMRDDYSINRSVVGFGNVSYKSDPLKGIDYLVNPSGGLGWKIRESDKLSLQADAGAGVLIERDTELDRKTFVSINSNQSMTYRLSKTASLKQKLDVLWKADDLVDYLVNISLSLATKITDASELQAEFLNDFRNKPADIAYKKNDIALILKYVVRF